MNRQFNLSRRRLTAIASALLLAGSSVLPMLLPQVAKAAQITKRRVEMSTSIVSASATGDFIFQMASGTVIQGIEIEFVDNPLGTYGTVPAAVPAIGTPTATLLTGASTGTLSGVAGTAVNGDTFNTWDDTTVFTPTKTDGTSFTGTPGTANNQVHLVRTSAVTETSDTGTDVRAVRIGGLTNNGTVNTTFFARVRIYSASTVNGSGQFNGTNCCRCNCTSTYRPGSCPRRTTVSYRSRNCIERDSMDWRRLILLKHHRHNR